MIAVALEMSGFKCFEADNATLALQMIIDNKPDMVLLDWMMPKMSGIELARRLRADQQTADIPIIMLTARDDEDHKVHGLEAGIDDYITKPFSPRELVARLKSVLRRVTPKGIDQVVEVDTLILDPLSHRASSAGTTLELGPTEYRLLQFFMTHQDRAYSRAQLLDMVWGGNVYIEERTIDVHIRRLRKALGKRHEYLVQTVRGTGYRFSAQTP
jgi:two-component system phosphate regulon response regulator PhoB